MCLRSARVLHVHVNREIAQRVSARYRCAARSHQNEGERNNVTHPRHVSPATAGTKIKLFESHACSPNRGFGRPKSPTTGAVDLTILVGLFNRYCVSLLTLNNKFTRGLL